MRTFYILFMVLGTLLPWMGFMAFFANSGVDVALFVKSLFSSGAASGFTLDILLSIVVFLVWSYRDSQEQKITQWPLVVVATFLVGLSLSLPIYLYMRSKTLNALTTSNS